MSSNWRRTYVLDGAPVPAGVVFVTCQACGRNCYWHVRDVDAITDAVAVCHFRFIGWTMNDDGFEALCPTCQDATASHDRRAAAGTE